MAGIHRVIRSLFAVLITLIILAVAALLIVEATDRFSTPEPANLHATLICSNTQSCHISATLTAEEQPVLGPVVAEIEGGVRFLNDGGRLLVEQNGHRAVTALPLLIPVGESRTLTFPLHPDNSTRFSGAYVMTLRLENPPVADGRYTTQLPVHVFVRNEKDVHVLSSSPVLDAAIANNFRPGTGNLAYALAIDPLSRTEGTLFVRVAGVDNAIVTVSVPDGILFTESGDHLARKAAGLIRPGGYRILPFPFHYEPGSYTGPRHITAGLNLGADTTWQETLPFQLQINDGGPAGQPSVQLLPGN